MTASIEQYVQNNRKYAEKTALHNAVFPGPMPIQPARRLAVVACMDARLDVEDLLGLQTGEAHIIRNAGGVVNDDVIRSLIISHHLLNTNEIVLIHHTRCGMLAFTDDLLRAGLEGDAKSSEMLSGATRRNFTSPKTASTSPAAFHAFRGPIEALDAPKSPASMERLAWDVRRGISAILNHPWIPTGGGRRRRRARLRLRRGHGTARGGLVPRADGIDRLTAVVAIAARDTRRDRAKPTADQVAPTTFALLRTSSGFTQRIAP